MLVLSSVFFAINRLTVSKHYATGNQGHMLVIFSITLSQYSESLIHMTLLCHTDKHCSEFYK